MKNQPREKFPERPRLIFMGTPDFAVPSLKALVEHGHNVLSVVTQPDRPKGRGRKVAVSPVKQLAVEYGLETLQPEKVSSPEFCDKVRRKGPELFLVAAFGQILNKDFLDIPTWGAINIHASLLPKYRGAAPINWAILNNEKKTGLTAMRMDEGLDTGPILFQEEVPIFGDETAGQLHDRLAHFSGKFIIEVLRGLAADRFREIPQDEKNATYASKIDRSVSLVKWTQSAQTISAFIRAFDPWPGALTTLGSKEMKLFSSRVVDENRLNGIPGRVVGYADGALEVETGKGVVQIRDLQSPGKKRLPAKDFLRGFPLGKGALLG